MFEFDVSALDCNQLNFLKYKAMEGLSYNTLYGYSKDFTVAILLNVLIEFEI